MNRLCTLSWFLLLIAGCSASYDSKDAFLAAIRQKCTRSESRVNPKPLLLSKLQRLAGPHEVVPVDDLTQKWTHKFADGEVNLFVSLETGSSWTEEDPMVFVDFKRIEVQELADIRVAPSTGR